MDNEMRITKVKIELQHSDGYWTNIQTVMPSVIAEEFTTKILDWEETHGGTVKEVKSYLDSIENVDWVEVSEKRNELERTKNNIFD